MAFARAWRPLAAARCSTPGARAAARIFRPDGTGPPSHGADPLPWRTRRRDGGRIPATRRRHRRGSPLSRLKKRAEFQRVSRGARKSARAFTLQAAERADGDPAVGRSRRLHCHEKIGNSPIRNRIRRRLKKRCALPQPLEARADHDYVLMARRDALSAPLPALVDALREAFRALARAENIARETPREAAGTRGRNESPERKGKQAKMKSEDTRNLFLAIALSVLVMAGWQYFYAGP